jgi:integrase
VLGIELPWLENVTRASRPKRLPVVLTAAEVRSVLSHLDGTSWLIASLLYGSGLRLMEAHRLRVKDLMIERGEVIVRDAKGGKDRVTVLPASLVAPLREYLAKLFDRFERQRKLREPGVSLPTALAGKYPYAAIQWGWQWVFPANSLCRDPYTGGIKKLCSARSRRRFMGRVYCSRRVVIPFATALPRICSRRAPIFARCRNCSVTPMWELR